MLKNYFLTAWRSLLRGKNFSIINIGGLAIGMAGAILILLWLQNEVSFDRFHANQDRLYSVYGLAGNTDNAPVAIPIVSQPLGPALQQKYPEVEATARVRNTNRFLFTVNGKSFTDIEGAVIDPGFLQLFSFPLEEGRTQEQLQNVYSITITQKLATQLFGKENAIGKTIQVDSTDHFTVTGVLKDLPSNTRFHFDYLLPWAYLKKLGAGYTNDSWLSNNTPTYVLLKKGTDATAFNAKIKDLTRVNSGRADVWTHFLFPLHQWYLYGEFENGKPVGGRISTVRVFGIIAILILLIACINFMNLSTARSEKRAKEVGIRKVAGAGKGLLIGQFMAEAFLTACLAGLLSFAVVQMVLPAYNKLINTELTIPYANPTFWLCALAFLVVTSLLAGSYPAFYLSSFKPTSIFSKRFRKMQATLSPRKVLVVVQFTFAVVLITSTLIIRNQVKHAQDRDTGYAKNDIVYVNFVGDIAHNYSLIRQELLNKGIATAVTKNMIPLTEGGSRNWGLRWQGENPKDTNTTITVYSTDAGLVKTAGLQLIAGRDIDVYQYPTDSAAVLLNETAVKLMGFKDPIGQTIYQPHSGNNLHVVGVVKDYIVNSAYGEIPPTVIQGPGSWFSTMHIRFNPARSTAQNIASAETVFRQYNAAYPFNYRFIDEAYAEQFDEAQRTRTMAGLFAALAIFISCLGLFGLSAYVAESRIKEIGVRKVLGASVLNITHLLSVDFIKLVAISILIATPLAWYAMNQWLENYTYRIQISWITFVLSGTIAIGIALATVSFQSVRAALTNPARSLKTD